jgi:hypothetical protein
VVLALHEEASATAQMIAVKTDITYSPAAACDVFHAHVPSAHQVVRGRGNLFRRLDNVADLYAQHLSIDLRDAHSEVMNVVPARHRS